MAEITYCAFKRCLELQSRCSVSVSLAPQSTFSREITSLGRVLILKLHVQVKSSSRSSSTVPSAHPHLRFHPHASPPLLFLLMCNKQRLCTIFTQNILCLVSCRCTQNSCCSSPQHPIVSSLNHISAPPKGRRQRLKATPHPHPPTQTSSRQQCGVLHKKERGNMKTQTASQGIQSNNEEEEDPKYR